MKTELANYTALYPNIIKILELSKNLNSSIILSRFTKNGFYVNFRTDFQIKFGLSFNPSNYSDLFSTYLMELDIKQQTLDELNSGLINILASLTIEEQRFMNNRILAIVPNEPIYHKQIIFSNPVDEFFNNPKLIKNTWRVFK